MSSRLQGSDSVKPPRLAIDNLITPRARALRERRAQARSSESAGPGYTIRALGDGVAEILIYDEISYWGISADAFARELATVDAGTLNVRLNSPGGDVFDGVAIYNSLVLHPATVNVTVEGLAASIASVIMQAGDTRTVMAASQTMIHDAWGIVVGSAADMLEYAAVLERVSEMIAGVYAARTGTPDGWRDAMLAETWYGPDEAVAAGLADSVYAPGAQPADSAVLPLARAWDLSIFQHAGREAAPVPTTVHNGLSTVDTDPTNTPAVTETAVPVGLADLIRKAVA
jgi:ATP-dependent protease ClpP protease subunit